MIELNATEVSVCVRLCVGCLPPLHHPLGWLVGTLQVGQVFHPNQDRIVSVRECARSQVGGLGSWVFVFC